jgi:hypothetical protein
LINITKSFRADPITNKIKLIAVFDHVGRRWKKNTTMHSSFHAANKSKEKAATYISWNNLSRFDFFSDFTVLWFREPISAGCSALPSLLAYHAFCVYLFSLLLYFSVY